MAAYDKHLAQIEKNLQPGEEVVDSLSATVTTTPTSTSGTNSGALVATNKRLIWSGGFMFQSDSRSFPWQQISTIDFQSGMLLSHITVTGASALGRWLVAKVPKTQQFVETANSLVHQIHAPAAAPAPASAPSTADELAKLAQLRQQGILTDEEFAAAKARLLA